MKYGFFDDEAKEYVITNPATPLPWINYLGNEDFFGLISNTGGGYCFYKDARMRRLTRYRYNNTPLDMGGRYLYVRDHLTGEFWSPTWMPVCENLDRYQCRHGLGYTQIETSKNDISVKIRYFVPQGETVEVWQVWVSSNRETPVDLSLFACVEFALWEAWDDATNFQRNFSTGQVEVTTNVIYHKTEYRERRDHFAYFACNRPFDGFDTQRDAFLGAYRGWDKPEVVLSGMSKNSIAHGWQPIAAPQLRLKLAPGETQNIIFLLGYWENPRNEKFDPPDSQIINKRYALEVIDCYLQSIESERAFSQLKEDWKKLLDRMQVNTPDIHTNRMVNIWNAYQCMITFNLSRSASYFESGIGRGMGFRDSNQDLLGFVHMIPERARQRILDLAATQMESGGAYHQYQPLTKRGNNDVGSNFNDDPLWLIVGVGAYIKETGDWSILNEPVPYDNQPGSETPLFQHLQRSVQYTLERLGPHGLPLIGRADWNDCLNLNCFSDTPGQSFQTTTNKDGKIAESVFIGGLFVLVCDEMADMLEAVPTQLQLAENNLALAEKYRKHGKDMTDIVLGPGWDGSWFRRAYDDFGDPIGSQLCDEGQIFIEPQGICVLGGIGIESGQAQSALESVWQKLATEHGIVLQQPAFSQYYLNLGEISSYPPGYKENAGIFCHTNPWIMAAEAKLGNGDRAFEYYKRINPSFREAISELHRCEPYVYAQMIAGRDAPTHGEAKNSWLTGTAAWNYVAISQWILGIRPTYNGLMIAPVIPRSWNSFTAHRIFRGTDYHISVNRIGPGTTVNIKVDGKEIAGRLKPILIDGAEIVHVDVTIG